jgi:putative tryptophan/tyrosine transport system substrate-binding protein
MLDGGLSEFVLAKGTSSSQRTRLELLHEVVPTATIVAALVNPTNPNAETESRELQAAARTLGLQLHVLHASAEGDFDMVFATLLKLRVGGLVIGADAFFNNQSGQLAALTLRHAVPTIYQYREFVAAGGLMSYGTRLADAYHQAGISVEARVNVIPDKRPYA